MVIPHIQLRDDLAGYASAKAKITNMIKNDEIIQIKRGIFLDANEQYYSLKSLSGIIYGPSYVSFASALSYHGLIPESVPAITCASFKKNKNKEYHTQVGDFYYYYVPPKVYPYGIMIIEEDGHNFLIANPEKAVCDSLYKVKGIAKMDELLHLFQEDWRLDMDLLYSLDRKNLEFLLPLYRKKSCNLFLKWVIEELS
jgi:predicted transcriptional regulator of viral defense system